MRTRIGLAAAMTTLIMGCATVDVTKTSKGAYAATNPNDVEILSVMPRDRPYEELGTISTTQWQPSQTAKMHNALRSKAAPLGAHAVVIINSGMDQRSLLWATGSAIRYTDSR